jgi:hypothetical protein
MGSILGTNSTVDWTTPGVEGTYTVSVTVSDGRGGTHEGTCSVVVAVIVTEGSIDVKSSPAEAMVYIDGTDTGNITPFVITDVPEGDHTIKLTLAGYKDKEGTVTVNAGETTYINWELEEAELTTVTIQPDDVEGKDAAVYTSMPAVNNGNLGYIDVGNEGGIKARTYIRFNLTGIPATAVVTVAELHLWNYHSTSPVVRTIEAYQVTDSWAENTITWDEQPSPGTVVQGSASLPASETNDFVIWELEVALVEGWLDGSIVNHGLVLIDVDEGTPGAGKSFRSSEYGTAAKRPKLVITYYEPTP